MIEDLKDGIKIAENPEEKFWAEAEDNCKKEIDNLKKRIIINEHLSKLFIDKLKPFSKA